MAAAAPAPRNAVRRVISIGVLPPVDAVVFLPRYQIVWELAPPVQMDARRPDVLDQLGWAKARCSPVPTTGLYGRHAAARLCRPHDAESLMNSTPERPDAAVDPK